MAYVCPACGEPVGESRHDCPGGDFYSQTETLSGPESLYDVSTIKLVHTGIIAISKDRYEALQGLMVACEQLCEAMKPAGKPAYYEAYQDVLAAIAKVNEVNE